jgi:hypothetical protein
MTMPKKSKRAKKSAEKKRDFDERVSLHGPEYETVVRALLDTPKDAQATSDKDKGSDGASR